MIVLMKRYHIRTIEARDGILHIQASPKRVKDVLYFTSGQYASIAFRGQNGRISPMRCFSIVSAGKITSDLEFAIKIGGSFTKSLSRLQTGDELFVLGPFGEFTIDTEMDTDVVMIAGGIGVTPFMSMIRAATHGRSTLPMTLIYSYRSEHEIPFREELLELERRNPYLKVIMFATQSANIPDIPRLLSGKMTQQHLDAIIGNRYPDATYFLCGPTGFMDSIKAMLLSRNVDEQQIVTESFAQSTHVTVGNGYSVQKLAYTMAGSVLLLGVLAIGIIDVSHNSIMTTNIAQSVPAATTPASTSQSPASSSGSDVSSQQGSSSSSNTHVAPTPVQTYQSPRSHVS